MSNTLEEPWRTSARERIAQQWHARDGRGIWETVQNPANTVSRAHLKTLEPEAPRPKAPLAEWRDWCLAHFPTLAFELAARQTLLDQHRAIQQALHQREVLKRDAERGPAYRYQGTVYPHALAFVQALLAEGYTPEKRGIGAVVFRAPDRCVLGPYRRRPINAAVAYLTT